MEDILRREFLAVGTKWPVPKGAKVVHAEEYVHPQTYQLHLIVWWVLNNDEKCDCGADLDLDHNAAYPRDDIYRCAKCGREYKIRGF